MRLIHNYWGVMLSLVINGFPFTFLLTLSYVTGIDPSLEQAGAMLGARARERFKRILLPLLAPGLTITLALAFVQAFSVFPSAILLGEPSGSDAGDLDRRLHRGVRAVRLPAGLGDRHAHGRRAGADRGGAAGAARACSSAAPPAPARAEPRMRRHPGERLWAIAVWAVVVFFIVNLLAMIGAVVVDSFGTHWFNTWLPAGFTTQWYSLAWNEFGLPSILMVTAEVVGAVVLLSALIGVPDRLRDGAARVPRQARGHAAVPAAADGAADHLRHPAGDRAVPGAPGRQRSRA